MIQVNLLIFICVLNHSVFTLAQIQLYGKCDGLNYSGSTKCSLGLTCFRQHEYYSQCLTSCPNGWQCGKSATSIAIYGQCGGNEYTGLTKCDSGLTCFKQNEYYSQCLTVCPPGWQCSSFETIPGKTTAKVSVPLYGQCGGLGYKGSSNCDVDTKCFIQHEYYSQCLTECPPDWQCNQFVSHAIPTPPLDILNAQPCKFHFGAWYNGDDYDYSGVDYIGIWIGSPSEQFENNFNPNWHGEMLETCKKHNKIPVYYGYIIAFLARSQWNLLECDEGTPNLCEKGADFIRAKRTSILITYLNFARETSTRMGSNYVSLWLIEPDFWQYHGELSQENGGLSGVQMRMLFDEISLVIKSQLKNALISWDINARLSEEDMAHWWSHFATSPHINFIHTSEGTSEANSPLMGNHYLKWSFMSQLTGKSIIADTGFTDTETGSSNHNYDWDNVYNLRSRINDGVVAVIQANARFNWTSTLNNIRTQLPDVKQNIFCTKNFIYKKK